MKVQPPSYARPQAGNKKDSSGLQHRKPTIFRYPVLTPLGPLELSWTSHGLRGLSWCVRSPNSPPQHSVPFPSWLDRLVATLQLYGRGRPVRFRGIPIDWTSLRPFQRLVLRACRRIPYGKTISYQELAQRIGRADAVRAVARALATNPLPIIIPCHRVVRKGGSLGGYSAPGGRALKRRLLMMEKQTAVASASNTTS